MAFTESPKQFQSQTVIGEILEKLINVKNSRVDHILGNYFFKHEKVIDILLLENGKENYTIYIFFSEL